MSPPRIPSAADQSSEAKSPTYSWSHRIHTTNAPSTSLAEQREGQMRGHKRKNPGTSTDPASPPSDRGHFGSGPSLPSSRVTRPFASPREQHLLRRNDASSSDLQQEDKAPYRRRAPVSSHDGTHLDGPAAHSDQSICHTQGIPEDFTHSSPNSQRALPSRLSSQAYDRDIRRAASPFQLQHSQRLAAGEPRTSAGDDWRYDADDHGGSSSLAQRRGDAAHFKAKKLHIDVAESSTATEADESGPFSEHDRDHRLRGGQYYPNHYPQTAYDASYVSTPRTYRDAGPISSEAVAPENSITRSAPATRSSFSGPMPHYDGDAQSASHSYDGGQGALSRSDSQAGHILSPSLMTSSHNPPGGLSQSHSQRVTLPPPLQEGDPHHTLPPLALFQQDRRKAPLTGLPGPPIPVGSASPPPASRTRRDTDGPLQQPLPPPGIPAAAGNFATPASAVPSPRYHSMQMAQLSGASTSAAAGGPPPYRPAMQRPFASPISAAAGPGPASAPAVTARLPEHLRTPTGSKTQFLGLFSDFYDSLQDSRALKATLEDQIRRSATILETLQQGYKTMERVMTEERGKWGKRIERLEEQINVLEGRHAAKSQFASSPRSVEETLQTVDGAHETVAPARPSFGNAEAPSTAKGKGRPKRKGGGGGGGGAISRPSTGKETEFADEDDELEDGRGIDGDEDDREKVGNRSFGS